MELVGGSHETVVEIVAGLAQGNLLLEETLQFAGLDGRCGGSEDDALSLLDGYLEIAGHVEVLVGGVAALLLFRVFHSPIPVGLEDKLVFLVKLHIEVGIAGVHTGADAVFHLVVLPAGHIVLVRKLSHGTEGEEGTEAQRGGTVGIDQRIADEDAVFIALEDGLALQQYSAHAVEHGGHHVAVELPDVFVAVGTVMVPLVFVESEVELGTVLNHRTVEGREQHMIFIVQFGYGNNEQTVVLARVAVGNGRTAVGSRSVCPQQFPTQRLLQVRHYSFFKS